MACCLSPGCGFFFDDVSFNDDEGDGEESDDAAAADAEIRWVASGRGESWSTMLPELLGEIIRRVEASKIKGNFSCNP